MHTIQATTISTLRKSGDQLELAAPEPPYFHILLGTQEELDDFVCKLGYEAQPHCVIRLVRGNKMMRVGDLFNEFASAFQFPLYFGENWPAFSECIRDLAWLRGQNYILTISNAQELLAEDDPRDRGTFIRILHDACVHWATKGRLSQTRGLTTVSFSFHAIFHAVESHINIVREILSSQYPDLAAIPIRDMGRLIR